MMTLAHAALLLLPQILGREPVVIGPYVGALAPRSASVLVRALVDGPAQLSLIDAEGRVVATYLPTPSVERDRCVRWDIPNLQPDAAYAIAILGERTFFRTPQEPDAPGRVSIAFGSCADDRPGLENPVWAAMAKDRADATVLIGDTPYIDSTDLATQRRRYKEFLGNAWIAARLKTSAFYATWDDHDFAGDGADGKAEGKEAARRAFLEYHANPSAGEGEKGVYTRFRLGAADVFLLDTRWFSNSAPSFADPGKPTLLGAQQWLWLQRELEASTAPFKLLVSGMVWNGAVRPGKPDHWMAWPHERAALFRFLAEKRIAGVVLVGGDVHRSRALVHPPEETGVAYPLHEWITSPLGTSVMASNDAPHASLVFDRGEPHAWLHVSAGQGSAGARIYAAFRSVGAGEMHRVDVAAEDLRPHAAIEPAERADEWARARSAEVLARARAAADAQVVFLGDSITQGWEGEGQDVWASRYAPRRALNLGVSGDRTQHVLWRIDHGQLDGLAPKAVVLMIGTNNSNGADHTAREIADGIGAVVGRIRRKLPGARVLLLAVFPRGEAPNAQRGKNAQASDLAAKLADGERVRFLDIGTRFLGADGAIPKEVMPDFLHLSEKGYAIWAEAMEEEIAAMLGGR